MILQEDTARHHSALSEAVKTGAYKTGSKEFSWDINDTALPKDITPEEFQEWPNGHCKHVYSEECEEARKHTSSWAMRNTNNHNVNILKKSCLGVLVCTVRCTLENGDTVHLRPAICDKARRKQLGKPCPNVRCNGKLELQACQGHGGYPVTHFWRHIHGLIFFQAKGEHNHASPEAKSTAEVRRQRYSVKENRTSLLPGKTRKRVLAQPDVTSVTPLKPEPTAACNTYPHVPKVRRVCSACLPYDCRCTDPIISYPTNDILHNSAMREQDGMTSDGYQATSLYYTYQYAYPHEEKPVQNDHYYYENGQWMNYPYNISQDTVYSQTHDIPTATNSHQYYMENPYKYTQPYSPCMYDPQFVDYRGAESESLALNTSVQNSQANYYHGQNNTQQPSPHLEDTYTTLQRPNSCHATPTTLENVPSPDAQHSHIVNHETLGNHSNSGSRSPYQQSHASPSHVQNFLVNDGNLSDDSSVVNDVAPYSNMPMSNRPFQLPAIVAAVGSAENCDVYRTISESSPQRYVQNHY